MRILVRCDQCRRQYDASGKSPGKRFRCQCGSVVIVPQPSGHDAAVVTCSSCGAPRQGGAADCPHCGSDFTLHERDLHTICPNCLARVSDRARYCHHCAHLLTSESLATATTEHVCPACGEGNQLNSRRLAVDLPEVLECSSCTGMWLSIEAMEHLIDAEAAREAMGRSIAQISSLVAEPTPQAGPAYRPCALCCNLMMRRNFGQGASNVIVDICRVHGIWFDANELAALLRWMRTGGLPSAQAELARFRRDPQQRLHDARSEQKSRPVSDTRSPFNDVLSDNESMAAIAVNTLLALFDF